MKSTTVKNNGSSSVLCITLGPEKELSSLQITVFIIRTILLLYCRVMIWKSNGRCAYSIMCFEDKMVYMHFLFF